jgi:hypothetical protein
LLNAFLKPHRISRDRQGRESETKIETERLIGGGATLEPLEEQRSMELGFGLGVDGVVQSGQWR